VFGLLLVAGLVCLGLAVTTGQARWRQLGVVIIRWTVVAGLAALGLLVVERLAVIL
jgi:hypothetical protein